MEGIDRIDFFYIEKKEYKYKDCKIIPGESVITYGTYRLMVLDFWCKKKEETKINFEVEAYSEKCIIICMEIVWRINVEYKGKLFIWNLEKDRKRNKKCNSWC